MSLKTTTLTEGRHPLEFMLAPANFNLSVDNVTILSGQILPAGAVLAKVTASGKYTAYNDAGSGGAEVAAGILAYAVDATAGDTAAVAVVRQCEVIQDALYFPSATGDTARAHAFADLALLGIACRPSHYAIPSP